MSESEIFESIVKECNEECMRCRRDYEKAGIPFDLRTCDICGNGAKLHRALIKVSKSEQQFDNFDWSTSENKRYYHRIV